MTDGTTEKGTQQTMKDQLNVIWDMETSDPDDFFTLLFLLGHPRVNLKAVTVTPGTKDQIGVVRAALSWFGRDIPVGAFNLEHDKQCVSKWHYDAFGKMPPSSDAEPAGALLARLCDTETTLITGAALRNLGRAMLIEGFQLGRLVAQGGFAGEGVVPPTKQLEKFKGLTTCPSFNMNGDPKSALACQVHAGIKVRRFVSKNVCHGVVYDQKMHDILTPIKDKSLSLSLIWKGMEAYLDKRAAGKAFHDPLAAVCAIDESVGEWAEVDLYRAKGEWGSALKPGSNTWIITDYHRDKFIEELFRY
jgi:inosine-uridine nucleoside N-ribohydrolase